jgi:hypothetical protein
VDNAFPIASLSNDEINKLLVELSTRQGLQAKHQQMEQNDRGCGGGHQQNVNNSSNEISLDRTPSLASTTTVTEDDTQHYQLGSIDQEEDTPIVMNHLHSVKSLKKFFEIKANNKSFSAALTSNVSILKPSNSMCENNIPKFMMETSASDSVAAFSSDLFAKNNNQLSELTTEVFSDSKAGDFSEESRQLVDIPRAPPLPDFFGSKCSHTIIAECFNKPKQFSFSNNESREDDVAAAAAAVDTSIPPVGLTSFNQNIVSKCKELKLHERLIREIHHKTLERSKKDVNLSLDKHGNLISRNHVYKADGNMRRFSRHLKKSQAESFIQAMIKNENDNDAAAVSYSAVMSYENETGGQNANSKHHKYRTASFRADLSVRSTGSAYSSRSMLSEAKAKLEAYSGGKTKKPS